MPFWKKSEDPWDIDPSKRRPPVMETEEGGEPVPGILEELRDWNEARKQKKAESGPPPIPCPWCGKEMERRYIAGGRDHVWLRLEKPGFLSSLDESLQLDDEGGFFYSYKTIWYCRDCGKAAMILKEPEDETLPDTQDDDDGGEE